MKTNENKPKKRSKIVSRVLAVVFTALSISTLFMGNTMGPPRYDQDDTQGNFYITPLYQPLGYFEWTEQIGRGQNGEYVFQTYTYDMNKTVADYSGSPSYWGETYESALDYTPFSHAYTIIDTNIPYEFRCTINPSNLNRSVREGEDFFLRWVIKDTLMPKSTFKRIFLNSVYTDNLPDNEIYGDGRMTLKSYLGDQVGSLSFALNLESYGELYSQPYWFIDDTSVSTSEQFDDWASAYAITRTISDVPFVYVESFEMVFRAYMDTSDIIIIRLGANSNYTTDTTVQKTVNSTLMRYDKYGDYLNLAINPKPLNISPLDILLDTVEDFLGFELIPYISIGTLLTIALAVMFVTLLIGLFKRS